MHTRRETLSHSLRVAALLAATGLFPPLASAASNRAAFDAKNLAEALKALGAGAPVESKDVVLTAPDIAENGAVVPLIVSTTLTGVRQMLVLVDKNPSALAAVFTLSDSIEPNLSARIKMAQSSDVYGVAITTDGRVRYAKKDVKVTLGGCG